jgi:hypothetical protein
MDLVRFEKRERNVRTHFECAAVFVLFVGWQELRAEMLDAVARLNRPFAPKGDHSPNQNADIA